MPTPAGAIFTGFELYLVGNGTSPPTGVPDYLFANDNNEYNLGVVWTRTYDGVTRTLTYAPFPIEASGFEFSGEEMPRPKIRIANVNQMIGGIVRGAGDLIGAKICRWRTFAKYLNDENFLSAAEPGWVSQHDPTAVIPPDIYYVERKVVETKDLIEFELVSAMDLQGIKLPKRQVMANACPFAYRGSSCNYTGAAHPMPGSFDTSGNPITDGCDKSLTSSHGCRAHFGTAPANFGGFPGAGRRRSG